MNKLYDEFLEILETEDKEKSVEFVLSKLSSGELDILSLYREILAPSVNRMECTTEEESLCIWKEHVRTSIVRTILECCYPYIVKERDLGTGGRKNEKVIVVCPPEEYHELGARMAADYFTILGYDVVFVGANTPKNEIIDAIKFVKPSCVAISVSSFYNLVAAQKVISRIRESPENKDVRIIAGGWAFLRNPEAFKRIGADRLIETFEDIRDFAERESKSDETGAGQPDSNERASDESEVDETAIEKADMDGPVDDESVGDRSDMRNPGGDGMAGGSR